MHTHARAQALSWVVQEALTPLNFVLAADAAVWFVERAAAEHPAVKVCVCVCVCLCARDRGCPFFGACNAKTPCTRVHTRSHTHTHTHTYTHTHATQPETLALLMSLTTWLERWSASLAGGETCVCVCVCVCICVCVCVCVRGCV